MHKTLLKIFVERQYIAEMTEVEAPNPRRRITETFIVRKITPSGDDYVFLATDLVDGTPFSILGSSIVSVDGMTIDRIADVYSLTEEGEKIVSVLKQRGRKRKIRVPVFQETISYWDCEEDDYETDF